MQTRLTVSLLTAALCGAPLAASASDDDNRRYEGVVASATAVWVVDTRTGRVRKCTQEFADQTPVCSKLSN